jgi:hypothetical protein
MNMLPVKDKLNASRVCKEWNEIIFSSMANRNISLNLHQAILEGPNHSWSTRQYSKLNILMHLNQNQLGLLLHIVEPMVQTLRDLTIESGSRMHAATITSLLTKAMNLKKLTLTLHYSEQFTTRNVALNSLTCLSFQCKDYNSEQNMSNLATFVSSCPQLTELSIDPVDDEIRRTTQTTASLAPLFVCGERLRKLGLFTSNKYSELEKVNLVNLERLELWMWRTDPIDIEGAVQQFKKRNQQVKIILHFEDKAITFDELFRQVLQTLDFFVDVTITSLIHNPGEKIIDVATITVSIIIHSQYNIFINFPKRP